MATEFCSTVIGGWTRSTIPKCLQMPDDSKHTCIWYVCVCVLCVCCVCRWNTTLGHHVTWVIAVYCFSECRWFFFSSYFCFFHFRCCFRARTATANCPRPHLVDLPFSFLRGNKFTLFMHFLHSNRAKFDRHRAFKRTQIEMSSQRHNVWYMCVLCMWK